MISRLAAILVLTTPAATHLILAEEQPLSTVTVNWSDEVRSPGACVDRATWIISVIPDSVPLEGLSRAILVSGTDKAEALVIFIDAAQRLCLLEAKTPIPHLTPFSLAHAEEMKGGRKLNCLTNRSACLTTVAGKDWSYRGEQFPMPMLRVRVAEPDKFCSSGTPLVCDEGKLAGILNGQECEDTNEVHAIPVSRIRKLIEDVKTYKRSGPVRVGLVFHNQSSTPEVLEVKAGSPAEKSGLAVGDVILSMDGIETASLDDLVEVIHNLPAGAETPVTVLRGLTEKSLTITPEFIEVTAVAR
jgi:hypothetical protein